MFSCCLPCFPFLLFQSVQLDFAKKYLKGNSGDVILRVSDGRTWSMNLYNYKNSKFHFRTGWLAFVNDNTLEVGDVCVFMLKNKSQLLFEVVFFRIIESANHLLSPGKYLLILNLSFCVTHLMFLLLN